MDTAAAEEVVVAEEEDFKEEEDEEDRVGGNSNNKINKTPKPGNRITPLYNRIQTIPSNNKILTTTYVFQDRIMHIAGHMAHVFTL